jgi:hypothetical protein
VTQPGISPAHLLALVVATMLAGCASTQMNAQWRDTAFAPGSLKGQRVLVVCRAADEAMRRGCEDQWAGQLAAQGIAPVRSYTIAGFPWASGDTADEMKAAARASGAAALASMSLAPGEFAVVNPGPQVGIGIGGSSGGSRGGGFSFGGFGISFPIGGATATQGLGATSSLVDVASGRLVWSGSASTSASSDVGSQVGALTQVTIEAMRKAGLI